MFLQHHFVQTKNIPKTNEYPIISFLQTLEVVFGITKRHQSDQSYHVCFIHVRQQKTLAKKNTFTQNMIQKIKSPEHNTLYKP